MGCLRVTLLTGGLGEHVLLPEAGVHLLILAVLVGNLPLDADLLKPLGAHLVLLALGESRPELFTLVPEKWN